MKAKIIFFLSLLIPFTLIFLYVYTTATDCVFHDDTFLIKGGFIENYLNGTLTLADLWRPLGMIRFLGYNLLLLANIKWFSMNSKIFVFLVPFIMLISALLIYHDYRKSLAPDRSPEFIAATFFILTFIIFNVIQWQGLIFGYGLNFSIPMPFIIASFISLELFLTNGRKYWPVAFILPAFAVLFFGGTPIFAFAPALGLTFLCYLLTRRSLLTKDFWVRVLIISIFLAVIAFIYMFRIRYNDYFPDYSPYTMEIMAHPLQALQFLLAAFGASVVGVDAFFACDYFSYNSIVMIGLVVVLLYALALVLFLRSRMYERTYLPFFLIMHTCFHLVFMMIGRFGLGGKDYGMMSYYTCVSVYGLVAMVWIFIFILSRNLSPIKMLKGIVYAGLAMILAGLLLTTIVVWHIQPYRKIFFKELRDVEMHIDTATPDELERWNFDQKIYDSLLFLKQHKLNIYRSMPTERK